jgi:CHAT domain-containing protein
LYYIYDASGKIFDSYDILCKIDKYAIEKKDSFILAQNMNSFGIFFMKTRNYKEAVNVLSKGLEISKNFEDKTTYFYIIHNLAISYLFSKKWEKARATFNVALELIDDLYVEIQADIARSYLGEGKTDSALYHNKLALIRAQRNKDVDAEIMCNQMYGEIYSLIKNFDLADIYFSKVHDKIKNISDKREIIKSTILYAKNEKDRNNIDKAISLLEYCNDLFDYKRKIKNDKALPVEMNLIEVFATLGDCYLKKFDQGKKIIDLETANKYFDQSIQILEDMRKYHTNPYAIEDISSDSKYIYESAIEAALASYTFTKENKYKDKAFLIYQKYGGFNLKKSVAERKALDLAEKNESIKENYLKQKISLQNDLYHLNNEYNDSTYQIYEKSKRSYILTRDSLLKKNPRFRKINEDVVYVDSKSIQKNIDGQTGVLAYFFGKENLYQFIINKNDFDIKKVKTDSLLSKNAFSYLSLLADPDSKKHEENKSVFFNTSHYLYNNLIPSTNGLIKKLVIIPDGFLYRIPFEVLTSRLITDYSDTNAYLISKYAVNYLYYPAQLIKEEDKNLKKYFFGMGLEYDKYTLENMGQYKKDTLPEWINDKFRSESLSHLYFADDEVNAISDLYNGDAVTNENATKESFIANIPNSGIIHISAHSCVDFDDPRNSSIILTKKGVSDNLISYDDITTMDLNSQLVTLSACNSSIGKVTESEGVSSLTKAFFEAGSKSVVGSFWSVPDQISKIFMEVFYNNMKKGMNKDEALRAAKIEIMSKNSSLVNPAYKNPAYWAAWNIYGDVSPLEIQKNWKWLYFGLGSLALLLFIVFRRKRTLEY